MATAQIGAVIRHIRRARSRQDAAGCTDAQLLTSFVEAKDQAALEALVQRHGPMVFGVCRRLVGNHHDAEDAFQVAFLVLARKAASIKPRAAVANWLHGVAFRTAMKAKTMMSKRRAREKQVTQMPEREATRPDQWPDLQPLLDQELTGLPENYRLPILLCDLEGKTIKQAAQQLGWPQGTFASRLARGRKLLSRRLMNRGVVLSVGSLATVVSQNAALARVPASLMDCTVKTVTAIAQGHATVAGVVPAKVTALLKGVMMNMMLSKLMTTLLGVVLAALFIGGVGAAFQTQAAEQPGAQEEQGVDAPNTKATKVENVAPSPPRIDIERQYVVTSKLVKGHAEQPETVLCSPRMTLLDGQKGKVMIDEGPKNLLERVILDENIKIGKSFDVRVKRLRGNNVRLALLFETNEIEKADANEIRVLGNSVQAILDVELNKTVKFVFQKDAKGAAQRWVELKVDESTPPNEKPIPPPTR
jgi:RNA polymerase sigma factor (sigma-70 family)